MATRLPSTKRSLLSMTLEAAENGQDMDWFYFLIGATFCLKLLLMPSYLLFTLRRLCKLEYSVYSTDFEVHRNWLAITYSLPVSEWYYEKTSEWTLDYPPLFAWFEFALSNVAKWFDSNMLIINNLKYASPATILFQRLSVVVTDLVFIFAIKEYCFSCIRQKQDSISFSSKRFVFAILTVMNCGLLIVDRGSEKKPKWTVETVISDIHFQYNGFLFGILMLSINKIVTGKNLQAAFLFVILLNLKHIFLYIAPAYFVYLLREYCFRKSHLNTGFAKLIGVNLVDFEPIRFGLLGFIVIIVFALSFGPFIWMGQLGQVLSRLFPVQRGLCHAYWAANFWALYNTVDKIALIVGKKLKLVHVSSKQASMTGGLVAQQEHAVLLSIPPLVTAIFTVACMLPVLLRIWYKPIGHIGFLRCLILCAYSSFIFGYHVHEKAILLIIIPMCLVAIEDHHDAATFIILSVTGHFALFPLLYKPAETPIKICMLLAYSIFSVHSLEKLQRRTSSLKNLGIPFLSLLESLYIWGLIPLYVYCNLLHSILGFNQRFPFIPLLITSVYCTVGVIWSWIRFYYRTFQITGSSKKTQ